MGIVWCLRDISVSLLCYLGCCASFCSFLSLKHTSLFSPTANPKLGTWVHTQRRQFKLLLEGKKNACNREKIAALDSIGFFWAAKQKDGGNSAGIGGAAVDGGGGGMSFLNDTLGSGFMQPPPGQNEGFGGDLEDDEES